MLVVYVYSLANSLLLAIRDFLDEDMQRTKLIIGYLRPLLALENKQLEIFLTRCTDYSTTWTTS